VPWRTVANLVGGRRVLRFDFLMLDLRTFLQTWLSACSNWGLVARSFVFGEGLTMKDDGDK